MRNITSLSVCRTQANERGSLWNTIGRWKRGESPLESLTPTTHLEGMLSFLPLARTSHLTIEQQEVCSSRSEGSLQEPFKLNKQFTIRPCPKRLALNESTHSVCCFILFIWASCSSVRCLSLAWTFYLFWHKSLHKPLSQACITHLESLLHMIQYVGSLMADRMNSLCQVLDHIFFRHN